MSYQKEGFSLAEMKVLLVNQTNAERDTWITEIFTFLIKWNRFS